jgi:hypothetical protein
MIDAGENPSLLRDISCDSWQGNHTYAKLFRIALIFVDGKDPGDFFSYLRQGLDQALNI